MSTLYEATVLPVWHLPGRFPNGVNFTLTLVCLARRIAVMAECDAEAAHTLVQLQSNENLTGRPTTHDLLYNLLVGLGGQVQRSVIYDANDEDFFRWLKCTVRVGRMKAGFVLTLV